MPTRTDTNLPIAHSVAHSVAHATIALPAMVPDTLMLAKHPEHKITYG